MSAAVAPPGQRVPPGLALEGRAGHVGAEQVVVQSEALAQASDQVLLHCPLGREEAVQGPVEAIVVDQGGGQRAQVLQRGAAIPALGDVPLARRLAEPGQHQHRRHGRPRHRLPARRQQALEQLIQTQRAPERPAEPHVAEGPAALQPEPVEANGNRAVAVLARPEEGELFPPAGDRAGQGLRPRAALRIEFAQVRHRLLHDLAPDAHRADQPPVRVDLAILPARGVAQIHLLRRCATRRREVKQLGRHYTRTAATARRHSAELRLAGGAAIYARVTQSRKLG